MKSISDEGPDAVAAAAQWATLYVCVPDPLKPVKPVVSKLFSGVEKIIDTT